MVNSGELGLTFSQREGKAPLPEPMRGEHLARIFRNDVWLYVDIAISKANESFSLRSRTTAWPVLRVVDGDTVAVDASADLPPELAKVNVRLRGVDTPEKGGRAKCDAEKQAGQAATVFTRDAITNAQHVQVRDPEWGKWGGRVLADLILDGRSLSEELIAAGHGRLYDGGRRGSWCD